MIFVMSRGLVDLLLILMIVNFIIILLILRFSQEKRICINYNKALLLSTTGIKVKQRNFHTYTINRLLLPSFDLKVQFISRASSLSAYVGKRDLFYSTPRGFLSRRYYSSFLFSNSTLSTSAVVPVKLYTKVNEDKLQILKENEGCFLRSTERGVYRLTNLTDEKSYVGSSANLWQRLRCYFRISFLKRELTKGNSIIYTALLKYGYSKFSLEILEYCEATSSVEREEGGKND